MSAFAVLGELLLITAAFSRSVRQSLVLGLWALALLGGFVLFQGVLWWPWWIMLIAFLPWQYIGARATAAGAALPLSRPQRLLPALVVVQQLVASVLAIEARPWFSAYDMYSTSYASLAEYEETRPLTYRVVALDGREPVELPCPALEEADALLLHAAAAGETAPRARLRRLLGGCVAAGPPSRLLALEGDLLIYDWELHELRPRRAVDVIGPVPAEWVLQP
jgi:hypothetical protein